MKRILTIALCSLAMSTSAQPGRTTFIASNIKTVRLSVNGNNDCLPIIKLNGNEQLTVDFDDLTHEYERYTYRITHCDADGKPSNELFESDYVSATADDIVIDNYENSFNTTVLYTHYQFSFPNSDVRPLLSGNYLLTVSQENENGELEPVIKTYFAVLDTKVSIHATCTTNTDVDWNDSHQQIGLEVNTNNLIVRDAANDIKTVVLQNRRWDNAVVNPRHTAQNGNTLIWNHCRSLVFDAGNEYRKMEMLSTRYPGMHGESMKWFEPYFHYTLMTDAPRRNYLYDEDRNGLSVVRWSGSGDANTEADYVMTHFRLDMIPLTDGAHVFVQGQWTMPAFSSDYAMRYDENEKCYVADLLMKAGYYNYMYLCTSTSQPQRGSTLPVEGSFYQTENEYDVLVYYKAAGARYWQLVGCITPKYRKQ